METPRCGRSLPHAARAWQVKGRGLELLIIIFVMWELIIVRVPAPSQRICQSLGGFRCHKGASHPDAFDLIADTIRPVSSYAEPPVIWALVQ